MIPENQMKLALLEEFKKAYRYQNFYFESCEVLSDLIRKAIEYYQVKGLEIPNRAELYRLVECLDSAIQRHTEFKKSVLSADSLQRDDPKRNRRGLDRTGRLALNNWI